MITRTPLRLGRLVLVSGAMTMLLASLAGPRPSVAAEAERPGGSTAASAERSVAVTLAPITVRQVQRAVGAVGSFFGYDEVTVPAEVSGVVARVCHDVGDVVKPGDVLLEIDPTDYQLGLEETLRALQLELARILNPLPPDTDFEPSRATAILKSVDINKLPTVMRAMEQEKNARSRLQRAEQLRENRSISNEDYDQRVTDFEVAQAFLVQARLDAHAVLAAIRHRLVLLRIAKRKLDLTQVRVPVPTARQRMPKDVQYAVVERKVTEGEMLKDAPSTSTATFQLVMDGVLKLRSAVPERFVGQVREGQRTMLRVDAFPDKEFTGEVVHINPSIDRTSRTFQVEIYVDNAARQLKAGGFAKVEILTHVDPQAWTVPVDAVVSYAGSIKLFVVRDGRAKAIVIAPGVEGRGWVELIKSASPDLRADDQVITSGQDKLADGVPVTVRGEKK